MVKGKLLFEWVENDPIADDTNDATDDGESTDDLSDVEETVNEQAPHMIEDDHFLEHDAEDEQMDPTEDRNLVSDARRASNTSSVSDCKFLAFKIVRLFFFNLLCNLVKTT